mmetsp:Transcript_14450/g.33047  ORF Transcript_14450/g.33047 Transcript_14450/m.33047 type:complete len:289 (-) Transcript_14450:117-983(-)
MGSSKLRRGTPENASTATTRTRWSLTSCKSVTQWTGWQSKLRHKAEAVRAPRPGNETLLLLGDSITEEWGGTSCGTPNGKYADVRAVFDERPFGPRWAPLVLGISADQTQHLLWRITEGGELPAALRDDPRLVISLLIGTNNLGLGAMSPEQTAAGIRQVVLTILEATRARLLVNGLFLRVDSPQTMHGLCPPLCESAGHPLPSLALPVRRVNALVNASVHDLARRRGFHGRLRYADACGTLFENTDTPDTYPYRQLVRRDLMPDGLHPNGLGQRMWAKCLATELNSW